MKVVDDYAKKNKELENKVQASKGKVDAMTAQKEEDKIDQKEKMLKMQEENSKEPSTYHRIPFLKFSAGSKSLPQISSAYDCQDVCDRQEKCQSYSWSESLKTCMWSVDKIQYDDAFVFEV